MIANNLEYERFENKSVIVCDMSIKVDEENRLIFASDIISGEIIDTASEGILREVNSYIATKIENELNINIVDYGVEIFDETISISNEDLNNVF